MRGEQSSSELSPRKEIRARVAEQEMGELAFRVVTRHTLQRTVQGKRSSQ